MGVVFLVLYLNILALSSFIFVSWWKGPFEDVMGKLITPTPPPKKKMRLIENVYLVYINGIPK